MIFFYRSFIIILIFSLGFISVPTGVAQVSLNELILIGLNSDQKEIEPINTEKNWDTLIYFGKHFLSHNRPDSAILSLKAGLNLLKYHDNWRYKASFYKNLAGVYIRYSNYAEGLEHLNTALQLAKDNDDQELYIDYLTLLGGACVEIDDITKAKETYLTIKAYAEGNNKPGLLIRSLNALGDINRIEGNLDSALICHLHAITAHKIASGRENEYWACTSLGKIYTTWGDCRRAKAYFDIVTQNMEADKLYNLSAQAYLNRAVCATKEGNKKEALALLERAYQIGTTIPDLNLQVTITERLANLYEIYNDKESSLKYFKIYKSLSDSLAYAVQLKKIAEMNFVQKEAGLLSEVDKNYRLLMLEKTSHANESKRFNQIMMATLTIIALGLLFIFFIYRSLRRNKKQNTIIERQKEDILHSIHYAKRIQSAILPQSSKLQKYFPDSFVFYRPKDIVSGDFFCVEQKGDSILFAAADCTGHGVPGAMVSVVCHAALNRSVNEFGLMDPGEILDQTRLLVGKSFELGAEEVRDGMDISLCRLDRSSKKLYWSGANNPLWIVRNTNEGAKLIEYKPTKQSVGLVENPVLFVCHEVELVDGDHIYLFSDGIVDQFGGEKGKKFKNSRLKTFFLEVADQTMEDQLKMLSETFENWKGELNQLDDICVLGIKY